jgi:hypothetical protein
MLADSSLQFDFKAVPPPEPPPWLKSLRDALRPFSHGVQNTLHVLGPGAVYLFWSVVALIVAVIVFLVVRELIRTRWSGRLGAGPKLEAEDWRPTQAEALALLDDVDRLAAQGRFAEAVHLLLHRSIQDIHGKRPNLVRPAYTSRDISGLVALPEQARNAFSAIARVVERSHFGGAPVDAAGFAECRRTYEAFAFPEVWA